MTKQWHLYLAGGLLVTSLGLHAEAWNCRNSIEVQCTDTACTTSEPGGVTPADVIFDTRGTFSICVYSGCWNGKGHVVTNGPLLVIQKSQADWSVPNLNAEMREDVSIIFSTKDHVALVKTGTLILPVHCSKPHR